MMQPALARPRCLLKTFGARREPSWSSRQTTHSSLPQRIRAMAPPRREEEIMPTIPAWGSATGSWLRFAAESLALWALSRWSKASQRREDDRHFVYVRPVLEYSTVRDRRSFRTTTMTSADELILAEDVLETRRRAEKRRHLLFLGVAGFVLAMALALEVRPDERVNFRGLANWPLPHACYSRAILGFPCPGCGLTR